MKDSGKLENIKIHLGCGLKTPKGWVNVDGSWNAWLAKYPIIKRIIKYLHVVDEGFFNTAWNPNIIIHDVRKRLPFNDNFAEAVYASHLLEHLYLEEEEFLLRECFRVLSPGGILRIVVPDLKAMIEEYMGKRDLGGDEKFRHFNPSERLNRRLLLRDMNSPEGCFLFRLYSLIKDFHSHKYIHDVNSLREIFQRNGFKEVQEKGYSQSRIKNILDIEEKESIVNGAGICIEGIKP